MDRVVASLLEPYGPLPQARLSRAVGTRPPCCGAATCELCPVDSRFSVLNSLAHVLEHPQLRLATETVATRIRFGATGGRASGVEALGSDGEPVEVSGRAVVLAASGFENPAILLRSGLERPATGRYLFDHAHHSVWVRVRRDVEPGRGATIATGHSSALLEGDFRSERSGAIAILFNPGIPVEGALVEGMLTGRRGTELREGAADLWRRSLPFDVLLEDVPRPERRVTLSPKRDGFGLPLVRVTYPPPSRYEIDGLEHARAELTRRLAPLDVEAVDVFQGPSGGHLLGTCRMGDGDRGVVDRDLRHLDAQNVFVVGGSAFPTYSPSHPTCTIAALAIRAGDEIARAFG